MPLWRALLLSVIIAASLVRLVEPERMVVWHDETYTALRVFGFEQANLEPSLFGGLLLSPADLPRLQAPTPENTWIDTLKALGRHPEHSPLYYLGARLAAQWVDPMPTMPGWLLLGLLLLAAILVRFCASAPRPARWFPCLLIGIGVAVVLGPDLVVGGSRSLHARYALPALLAVQLAVAWVLAAECDSPSAGRRAGATLALALLLGLGGWSNVRILQADTWWNKNFSAGNAAVARIINAGDRPLVVASYYGFSAGELISLAYHLRSGVALWGEPHSGSMDLPGGFEDLFVLTPSLRLREQLEKTHNLTPLLGAWQWYRAEPKAADTGQNAQRQVPFPADSDTIAVPSPSQRP